MKVRLFRIMHELILSIDPIDDFRLTVGDTDEFSDQLLIGPDDDLLQ